jgi:hypothetical protein
MNKIRVTPGVMENLPEYLPEFGQLAGIAMSPASGIDAVI